MDSYDQQRGFHKRPCREMRLCLFKRKIPIATKCILDQKGGKEMTRIPRAYTSSLNVIGLHRMRNMMNDGCISYDIKVIVAIKIRRPGIK
jgi:hypothetical protein